MKDDNFFCPICQEEPRQCKDSKHKLMCNQCGSKRIEQRWACDGLYWIITCKDCKTEQIIAGND